MKHLRRLSRDMAQEALAEKLNVSRQTVSKWKMDNSQPEMEKAIQLISQNWAAIDALVDVLMSQNHLRGEQIDSIFNTSAVTPRESKKRSR